MPPICHLYATFMPLVSLQVHVACMHDSCNLYTTCMPPIHACHRYIIYMLPVGVSMHACRLHATHSHAICILPSRDQRPAWGHPYITSSIFRPFSTSPPPSSSNVIKLPTPPPPNITSSVNMLTSISRFCEAPQTVVKPDISIRYINECLPTESMELKQTVNNAIIYAN